MIATSQLQKSIPSTFTPTERDFAERFFAQVDADDLRALTPEQIEAITREQVKLSSRKRGDVKIKFSTNERKGMSWAARRTYLDIVTDDMAFLIDSVAAYLAEKRLIIDLLLHPRLSVAYNEQNQVTLDPRGHGRQSHLHIVVCGTLNSVQQDDIRKGLIDVIRDVRDGTGDWQAMRLRAIEAKQFLAQAPSDRFSHEELSEYAEFLDYIYDNNFTFLGCRSYHFTTTGKKVESTVVKGSGLGLLRDERFPAYISETGAPLPHPYQRLRMDMPPLYISKVNRVSTVHRRVPLDAVTVHHFDEDGKVIGETLFIGLFTSVTYSRSLRSIPLVKYRAEQVIKSSGFESASHDGRALRHILEKYPRDELFQTTIPELQKSCLSILRLQERQRIALYCRPDLFGRYVSALVYVPRDRFETRLRLKFQHILETELGGTCTNYFSSVDDSPLVRILFTIAVKQNNPKTFSVEKVEKLLQDAGRVWGDALADAVHHEIHDDALAERLIDAYADAFSSDYCEQYTMHEAVRDIEKIEETLATGELTIDLQHDGDQVNLKLYTQDQALVLSDILPILENMGVRVVTEHPFSVQPKGKKQEAVIQDFTLVFPRPVDVKTLKPLFEELFIGVFSGAYENDTLNGLATTASLSARDVVVVRTYVRYLRQSGLPFSLPYLEQAITAYPDLAAKAVQLFKTMFDTKAKSHKTGVLDNAITAALDKVVSLDHDRIWRAVFAGIRATLRTNAYQTTDQGDYKPYLSIKLDSRTLDFLPNPKPYREIFVYSTRMEGVHLRNGRIARGGIRWSDRAEDFRTEVLGLMKAQTVKNAVIVPSGAKGGFIVKHPPKTNDRKAIQAEGIECYRYLVRGLLDITDNYGKGSKIIKPKNVVCIDGDDPYLVVAADKGTATFSDIANALSIEYGFWMNDAFASGGSAGYDHKAMGITARGAWESVKRHFREIGHDTQSQPFDVLGVGDMGGDVFGNGMLLSPYIRLVGAFNHIHIFCDPNPDMKASFAERQRLFNGVMGWDGYNQKLLSKGGRIYNRSDKVLELTPEIQKRFDINKAKVSPPELMTAMLKSQVDLMYLGGIGTFVKSSTETHADAGDRSNDACRINATELRAKVVGEGANLGFTQRARIEAGAHGVHLNADFIDNSAGVDTSDHEVNIKILTATIMAGSGDRMTRNARDKLLKSMTDEVAALVLADNYQQTQAISLLESRAAELLPAHQAFMQDLENAGVLDRALEFLPNDEMIAKRLVAGQGLTRPELGILLSYAKLRLREELLATDIPDQADLQPWLVGYFPTALQQKFRADIVKHPLKREIVATLVANVMINRLGPTFVKSTAAAQNVDAASVARAFIAVTNLIHATERWQEIEALDAKVPATTQLRAFHEIAILMERLIVWILSTYPSRTQMTTALKTWGPRFVAYQTAMSSEKTLKPLFTTTQLFYWNERYQSWIKDKVPSDLATFLASRSKLAQAPYVLELMQDLKAPLTPVMRVYLQLGDAMAFSWIRGQIDLLPKGDRWSIEAQRGIETRLNQVQAMLAKVILEEAGPKGKADVAEWIENHRDGTGDVMQMIQDLKRTNVTDLTIVMVLIQKIERIIYAA